MVDACVQRYSDDVDRKFAFEVTSSEGRSYLLQVGAVVVTWGCLR